MRTCLSIFFAFCVLISFSQKPSLPSRNLSKTMEGASFFAPDTVCVNAPFAITNTSTNASAYYWSFCVANANTNPVGTNLGNFGFSTPVFADYGKDGANYYVFVTNNFPGKLVRLDFGSSLLNTPTAHDFGNLGGVIPDFCEGIQIIYNEGNWYAIIVGGQPVGRIVKVEFGTSLGNNSPLAVNWGNIGNLTYPHDLYVFDDNGHWYGLTLNSQTNSISRLDFTSSFSNIPTGVNLGNIGNLNYPTGIYATSRSGNWYAFVTNEGGDHGDIATSSLSRLDFGNSLLNTPSGVNLGNPDNALRSARDLSIYQSCNEIFGYVVNFSTANDIVRLNFNNSLLSTPSAVSLGNIGNFSFPHCISKLFRVDNNLYCFVANATNNTISRLAFDGCNGASIPSSTLQNPPPIVYQNPGTYNINLVTDDGLPTQSSYCKQVVVVPSLHSPLQQKTICNTDSVQLTASNTTNTLWNTGSTAPSIYAKKAGTYWVRSVNAGGCSNIDSFVVSVNTAPTVKLGNDTTVCAGDSLLLDAGNAGADYRWQDAQTTQTYWARQSGIYSVTVTKNGCTGKGAITIQSLPVPAVSIAGDTGICRGEFTQLTASGGNAYSWSPTTGLSAPFAASTKASPQNTTTYTITATALSGCQAKKEVTIEVSAQPVFGAVSSKPVLCRGDSVTLLATGGDRYTWSPTTALSDPYQNATKASPAITTQYKVVIQNSLCRMTDSLVVTVPVATKPSVQTTKSNDIDCIMGEARLHTGGGSQYLWQPTTGLSDSVSANPLVRINETTTYHLLVTTTDGCQVEDSITVYVNKVDNASSFPVPSAFTPNGDGKNDCFGVRYWGDVDAFSLNIYNRWGQLLFHTNNPLQCWDGSFKGKPQPGEVYVYWIKAKTRCGDVFRKGSFALIR